MFDGFDFHPLKWTNIDVVHYWVYPTTLIQCIDFRSPAKCSHHPILEMIMVLFL
jgi:hypothetical protein